MGLPATRGTNGEIAQAKKEAFLAAYVECGTITGAAKAAKLSRGSHYNWLDEDEEYQRAWALAQRMAADNLEDVAVERAKAGSDTLLIFLLKGLKPERYRERYEITGKEGGPLEFSFSIAKASGHDVSDVEVADADGDLP